MLPTSRTMAAIRTIWGRLDTLYGYYSNQEQQAIAKRKQAFNGVLSILGVIGDAVQLAITGTTGIGSLVGALANTGYNMYAKDRAYAAERADAAWDQQMQETQRQDSLAQQKYKNEQAERQYQDTLRQQEFNNNATSEKLNIAKGEWALKQSKAAQSAQQAAANAGAKSGAVREARAAGRCCRPEAAPSYLTVPPASTGRAGATRPSAANC